MDKKPSRFSTSYYYSYFRLNKIVSVLVLTFVATVLITGYIVVKPFLTKGQQTVSNASLRLPDTFSATVNQPFTIPLALDTDTQNIYGVDVVLGFDITKVQLVDIDPVATESTTLKQFLPINVASQFDKIKTITDANASGLLKFSAVTYDPSTQNPTTVFLGNTTLTKLTFKPLTAGTTILSLVEQAGSTVDSNIALATNPPVDALQRTDQVTSTSVTITSETLPTNTLTPPVKLSPSVTPTPTKILPSSTPTITPTITPIFTPTPTSSAIHGLIGTYFNNKDLTSEVFKRIDNEINFNWGNGTPDASINPNTFSIRWTGFIIPATSGVYTFYITADDGIRLWVNNQPLINQWKDHSAKEFSGKISLTARQTPIKIEYYENKGKARVELRWGGPGISKQILPTSGLITQ